MSALYLPAPEPYTGADPCALCGGRRVTGDRFLVDAGAAPPLVVDVFCGDCGGCGRANHDDCDVTEHADVDRGEWPEEEFEVERTCASCSDRRWWACQSFNEDEIAYLRMPCGCSTPLLVPA
jgi:hypothetical protein